MSLKIVTIPDPILREKGKDLPLAILKLPKTQTLIKEMTKLMYAKDGVGIAAPQVGQSIQLCVISKQYSPLKNNKELILINPKWEKRTRSQTKDIEGCLSVPQICAEVKRYKKIKVTALNELGEKIQFEADNFPARVIQHEIDHLNGILIIDRSNKLFETEK